jgi:hypothetical protein
MKTCPRCNKDSPLSSHSPDPRYRLGVKSYCKPCIAGLTRAGIIKKQYGLSVEEYDRLMQFPDYCQGCERELGKGYNDRALDHDHKTGKIRGVLCRKCNSVLGYVADSRKTLSRLSDYLSLSYS